MVASYSRSIRDYFLARAHSTAIRIGIISFAVLSAFLFSQIIYSKIEFVRQKIASDEDLLLSAVKIGDYHLLRTYVTAFANSGFVDKIEVWDAEKKEMLLNYPEFKSEQAKISMYPEPIYFGLTSATIAQVTEISDHKEHKWHVIAFVKIGYLFLYKSFLFSFLLALVIYFSLRRSHSSLGFKMTKPILDLTYDLKMFKEREDGTFTANTYEVGQRFAELDAISDELETLILTVKQQQEMLKDAEVLKAKFRLARQVAHDIQSPLGALKAAGSALLNNKDASAIAEKAVKRIEHIISDLMENNKKSDNLLSTCNLASAIAEIISEKLFQNQKLIVQFDDSPSALEVIIEKQILQRIFSNIMNNAIEAVRDGVELKIVVKITEGERQARVSITDNGAGIAKEDLAKVVEYGFTKGKDKGSGMGLAHAKKELQLCGGNLVIESELEIGTTVHLYFLKREKRTSVG